jgi:hypothetical protein
MNNMILPLIRESCFKTQSKLSTSAGIVIVFLILKCIYILTSRNLDVCHVPLPPRNASEQMTLKMWDGRLGIRPSLRCLGTLVLVITSRRKQPHGHGSWQPRSMNDSFILPNPNA